MKNKMPKQNKSKVRHKAGVAVSSERIEKIKKAAEPLLKLLNEEYNPHVTAIVTSTSIELMEGIVGIPEIYDYLVD